MTEVGAWVQVVGAAVTLAGLVWGWLAARAAVRCHEAKAAEIKRLSALWHKAKATGDAELEEQRRSDLEAASDGLTAAEFDSLGSVLAGRELRLILSTFHGPGAAGTVGVAIVLIGTLLTALA